MEQEALEKLIEAILFYRGEAMRLDELAKSANTSSEKVSEALDQLAATLEYRGIRLIREGNYVGLATAPDVREVIETLRREELEGPLGKAGLETLAVVVYHGPLSRAEIEYIRGVNSSSVLRSLSMRGLIEKTDNPKDKRSYLYRATPELPAALGVSSLSALPNFTAVRKEIATLLNANEKEDTEDHTLHE